MGKPYVGKDGVRRMDLESGPVSWPVGRGQEEVGHVDMPVILECPVGEDMARQEYRLQSDLKYQVQKFGVGVHAGSGVINTDMDLTSALALVEESRQRWSALPVAIRERFSTWRQVEQAAASGELDQILKAAGLTPASGVSSDASASDSAPVTPAKGDSAS